MEAATTKAVLRDDGGPSCRRRQGFTRDDDACLKKTVQLMQLFLWFRPGLFVLTVFFTVLFFKEPAQAKLGTLREDRASGFGGDGDIAAIVGPTILRTREQSRSDS